MPRKTFFSFHFVPDNWRAAQVRQMGIIEGDAPISDNDWETIKKGGDDSIKKWIKDQMSGKSCAVVLIGSATAGRKWIDHEIITAWEAGKGVVGIHIHNLKDKDKNQAAKGTNPFANITHGASGKKLSEIVKVYDPPHWESTDVYAHIKSNIGDWVEEAVKIRGNYSA